MDDWIQNPHSDALQFVIHRVDGSEDGGTSSQTINSHLVPLKRNRQNLKDAIPILRCSCGMFKPRQFFLLLDSKH